MRNWLRVPFAAIVLSTLFTALPAHAQNYEVLHNFAPIAGGEFPSAGLMRDAVGNLYGTTSQGGTGTVCGNPLGCGTVFKISVSGVESVLYSFTGGVDGSYPSSGVIRDAASDLYGEPSTGGTTQRGIIFKIDPSGAETVLYNFQGKTDGEFPSGGLLRDSAGNLYGTTMQGGSTGNGTVFKLDPTGVKIVLHNFAGAPTDGAVPAGGVIRDSAGNFYGVTENGGTLSCPLTSAGCGTVYKLDSIGRITLLHSFGDEPDGELPKAGLARGAGGNLFGTTLYGGAAGFGTVFKINAAGIETIPYSFSGGADGALPSATPLIDGQGNLYSTTLNGGTAGLGTVFRLDSKGSETVLHSFRGRPDGAEPEGTLTMDASGNLYGTALNQGAYNAGMVFKITR